MGLLWGPLGPVKENCNASAFQDILDNFVGTVW